MGMKKVALPFVGMVMAEFAQVGLMIVGKQAMSKGMSNLVFIFYSNAFASLILLPSALLFHRFSLSLSLKHPLRLFLCMYVKKKPIRLLLFSILADHNHRVLIFLSAFFVGSSCLALLGELLLIIPASLWKLLRGFVSVWFNFCCFVFFNPWHVMGGFVIWGLIGFGIFFFFYSFLVQALGYAGILYSSPTLATAILNLIPAFTFILAVTFRSILLHTLKSEHILLGIMPHIRFYCLLMRISLDNYWD